MTSALNLTLKIKQTQEILAKLEQIKASFADQIQGKIDATLRSSQIVHFARVLVIDDLYIQVLTEFDGDKRDYTEFFRKELLDVFRTVFSLAENPPSEEQLNNADKFYEYTKKANLPALGTDGLDHESHEIDEGFLFSSYPGVLVKEILEKFPPTRV